MDWSPCCPRDYQFSPAPQFEGINSSAFCLLYHPDLTTICGPGKTTAFDYTDLCWQSSLCFSTHCLGLSLLSCKEAITFFFMAAVTIHSDFGAQKEDICRCFHHFPLYLPLSNGARCHDLSSFFLIFSLKLAISLLSFSHIKRLFSSYLLSAIRAVSCTYRRLLMFLNISQ